MTFLSNSTMTALVILQQKRRKLIFWLFVGLKKIFFFGIWALHHNNINIPVYICYCIVIKYRFEKKISPLFALTILIFLNLQFSHTHTNTHTYTHTQKKGRTSSCSVWSRWLPCGEELSLVDRNGLRRGNHIYIYIYIVICRYIFAVYNYISL